MSTWTRPLSAEERQTVRRFREQSRAEALEAAAREAGTLPLANFLRPRTLETTYPHR
jgi:hypothetical protein